MNTDLLTIRPLAPDEEPTEDEVKVIGTPAQMKKLARNLETMRRKARKAARAARKRNRS